MAKPDRRKATRRPARKTKGEEAGDAHMQLAGVLHPEQALMSREVICADQAYVQWLETWDLEHPQCPFVPAYNGPQHFGGNVYLVKKMMPRDQFEAAFGEIEDKRVH